MAVITWLIIGLIAGFIARWLVPGRDPMGLIGTLILGLVGSIIGGTLGNLVFAGTLDVSAAELLGSIVGAVIALLVWRQMGTRRLA